MYCCLGIFGGWGWKYENMTSSANYQRRLAIWRGLRPADCHTRWAQTQSWVWWRQTPSRWACMSLGVITCHTLMFFLFTCASKMFGVKTTIWLEWDCYVQLVTWFVEQHWHWSHYKEGNSCALDRDAALDMLSFLVACPTILGVKCC